MGKKKLRDLEINSTIGRKTPPYGVYSRFNEFYNLLLNSVAIYDTLTNKQLDFAVETFVKRALFDCGQVGFDKTTSHFYFVYGLGINEYGNPTMLSLVTANGKAIYKDASYDKYIDGAYLIKALPDSMSLSAMIRETTEFMTNCDLAMRQNLEACKTPYIVVCKNSDLQLSIKQAIQQKQDGQAVLVVSEELGDGLKAVNVGTEFLVDKFSEVRDRERDLLLNKLGVMTANINKRERVQGAEVNATLGQVSDYIYLIIDTFNKQMETYDINFEMKLNGSLEDIYLDYDNDEEGEQKDVDVNDAERMNNIDNGKFSK